MARRGAERGRARGGRRRRGWWTRLPDEELLDVPLRALGLRLEGTPLAGRVAQLERDLARAGLRFRPYVWLSTDWFTPDGCAGFAVPFYLTHPRLMRLERRHMLQVEGGSREECLKLLRHETAHALDNAYRLHRRRRWRETFGPFSAPYRGSYVPRPTSERFVLNLDYWYAQSHPAEDFAETFSVWLQPGSNWRRRYQGWPALAKLEFVDELMAEIAERPPLLRSRTRPESIGTLGLTLRTHYRRKQARYAEEYSFEYDEPLQRVFAADGRSTEGESAAAFLTRSRRELRERVASVTGQHPYLIDQVLKELVLRSRKLGLRRMSPEREARLHSAVLLTAVTMRFVRGGHQEFRR